MCESLDEIRTLDDLRDYVHRTLCQKENLLPEQFALAEIVLTRRQRDCGLQFTLRGPRDVELGAIWESDHNTLYFYDALGARYRKEPLRHRLRPCHEDRAAA